MTTAIRWNSLLTLGLAILAMAAAAPRATQAAAARLLPGPERNTAANAPNGLGIKKVAVIMYNYADNPATPNTAALVRERLCTNTDSTRAFVREVSFGAMSVGGHLNANGDVFGWFTLSANDKVLDHRLGELHQRATAHGFNAANYDVILYCTGFGDWGNAFGGKNAVIGAPNSSVMAHEIFHVLGLDHANGLRCTNGSGNTVQIADDYESVPYGDPFDSQGDGLFRHPNAYFKARMGWFFQDNLAIVPMDRTQVYTYTLKPIEQHAPGQTMAVRVPVPAGRIPFHFYWTSQVTDAPLNYFLEYRRPIGFDQPFGANAEVTNGVSIRLTSNIDTNHMTMLVDSDPQTATFADAPFTTGEVFSDPVTGVTIRVLSTNATEARVEVSVRANATVSSGPHLLWTHPASGNTTLWSTDAVGTRRASIPFGPYAGMQATHYQRQGLPSAKMLWTRGDGLLKIWNLDERDNLRSIKTIGPMPRWQGRSYQKLADTTARLLWSRDDGLASIWRLNANDDYASHVQHGPFVNWTARSYQKLSNGTAKMVWSRTDGQCSIWTLDAQDQYVSHKYHGPFVNWTATDYHKLPDGTARLTWTRTDGVASIWQLDAHDNYVRDVQLGPFVGWSLEGFWPQ